MNFSKAEKAQGFLGVDPGVSGGMAFISTYGIQAVPTPASDRGVIEWLSTFKDLCLLAVLEKVTGYIPRKEGSAKHSGQPGSHMFQLGTSYGRLRMCLESLRIPYHEMTPIQWQKYLLNGSRPLAKKKGTSREQWKRDLKKHALLLFGGVNVTMANADALLLAWVARELYKE